jgi:(p)ppGpp synthase/HD superfamily hydrolase
MNHTPQIKKAIQFSARKHQGQLRRESEPLPYITHPFSVAILVAEDGAHDDVVTAALLHDTIEDTETTREEIAAVFNEYVAELVMHVTEDKSLPWKARKAGYLTHLETAPEEALLIAMADKIDNIESKLEAFAKEGKALLERWAYPTTEYLWYHGEALKIAQKRLPDHRLTKRLHEVHTREREVLSGE